MFNELLSLGDFFQTPVRQLSLGQRMRADIAAALLHNPDVLFLDEPTIGLDVVAKARIRQFIQKINAEWQVTVVLTTHDLDEVENSASASFSLTTHISVLTGNSLHFGDYFQQNGF